MRAILAVLSLPLLSLAACGGGGASGAVSAGTNAPAPGTGGLPTTTPTPTPGGTGGTTNPTAPIPPAQTNMFDLTEPVEFQGVGSFQSLVEQDGKDGVSTLYQANASTVAGANGVITYNPRDGIFTVDFKDEKAGIEHKLRFQDPRHRQDADGARVGEPQVPLLPGFNYLQALDGDARFTFFYQRPGTSGAFVSLAGFERSEFIPADPRSQEPVDEHRAERGVLVFGAFTPVPQVPTTGAGSYDGRFLATMAGIEVGTPRTLQWIEGTSAVTVDFAKRTLAVSLTGLVGPGFSKMVEIDNSALVIPVGSTFTAAGAASWKQASGNFAGSFSTASFRAADGRAIPVDFTPLGAGAETGVAGASSIDGAFYGPDARNVGANFRIVSGVPNRRLDILGAFVGQKK